MSGTSTIRDNTVTARVRFIQASFHMATRPQYSLLRALFAAFALPRSPRAVLRQVESQTRGRGSQRREVYSLDVQQVEAVIKRQRI